MGQQFLLPNVIGGGERFVVFADESGTTAKYPCYGIGTLIVPESRLARFNAFVETKLREHGVVGEAKFKKVGTSHGLINFALDMWRAVLNHPAARFAVMVVHKGLYRKWHEGEEEAFYVTYTYQLRYVAGLRKGSFDVVIDNRSDSEESRPEVMGIVSNHMLRGLKSDSEIVRVSKEDSKFFPGLQVVDMFTGAVTHSHAARLKAGCDTNDGKRILIERMAAAGGWDDLCYDTLPKSPTNIWHFPTEWRGQPRTRAFVPRDVQFVTPDDLSRGPRRAVPAGRATAPALSDLSALRGRR